MTTIAELVSLKDAAKAAVSEADAGIAAADNRVRELAAAAVLARAEAGERVFAGGAAATEGAAIAASDAAVEVAKAAVGRARAHRTRCEAAFLRAQAAILLQREAEARAMAEGQWSEVLAVLRAIAARDGALYIKAATLEPFELSGWRDQAHYHKMAADRLDRQAAV